MKELLFYRISLIGAMRLKELASSIFMILSITISPWIATRFWIGFQRFGPMYPSLKKNQSGMPRVNLRSLAKIEEQLKGEKHVELVVMDSESNAVILRKQTGPRVSTRLVVRI